MKRVIFGFLIAAMWALSGCTVLQNSLVNAYNLVNCEYSYRSVSTLTISDMNLSDGLNVLMIPKVLSILSGNASSIPLNFTLNLDVKNPNSGVAAFQSMEYILMIDDVRFANGNFRQPFHVDAGETQILPMMIGFDVAELMKKNTKSAVENIVKFF
jgi:LEA14-like dessication related protein